MGQIQKSENNPNQLIQLAVEKGASIENLEKLMDLQDRWEKKEAKKAFYNAKAKFQEQKPSIPKTKKVKYTSKNTNKTTEYSFAALPDIQKHVDPLLAKLGLSYEYKQKQENGQIEIACVLSHDLGHSEITKLAAPADTSGNKNSIQSIGSTVTYLKRYTLCNAIGLSPEDDNDGESGLTNSEVDILKMKVRLTELYIMKKSKLEKDRLDRLEMIIMNDEKESYQKSINILEKI